jgi:hypothetical protein
MADPKTCRALAVRCAALAKEARDRRLQTVLYEMSVTWLKVAAELDRLHEIIDDEVLGLNPSWRPPGHGAGPSS